MEMDGDGLDAKTNEHGMMGLPAGQSLQNTLKRWSWRTWMDGDMGQCKQGSRHGVMTKAGKQGMARRCGPGDVAQHRSAYEAGRPPVRPVWVWKECGGAGRSEGGLGLP